MKIDAALHTTDLMKVPDAARKIAQADPFVMHGLRTFELREWTVMEGSLGIKLNFSDQSLVVE